MMASLESKVMVSYYLSIYSKALIALIKDMLSNKLKYDRFRVINLTLKDEKEAKSYISRFG